MDAFKACPQCHRPRTFRVVAALEYPAEAVTVVGVSASVPRDAEVERDALETYWVCRDCGQMDRVDYIIRSSPKGS